MKPDTNTATSQSPIPVTSPANTPKKLPPLKGKRRLWLRNYLDINNPKTFMNASESAKRSNYQGKDNNSFKVLGSHNVNFCYPHIEQWLETYGLSDNRLKLKLLSLTEAKETKFFSKNGQITDQIEVEALGIQQKSLDMAFKIKGLYQDGNNNANVQVFNVSLQSFAGLSGDNNTDANMPPESCERPVIDVSPSQAGSSQAESDMSDMQDSPDPSDFPDLFDSDDVNCDDDNDDDFSDI